MGRRKLSNLVFYRVRVRIRRHYRDVGCERWAWPASEDGTRRQRRRLDAREEAKNIGLISPGEGRKSLSIGTLWQKGVIPYL